MFDALDARYVRGAMEAIQCAVERDLIIEINTGAMSRGYRTEPYPSRELLKEIHMRGGRILISSDCHRTEWIDFAFEQAAELARECGFREIWEWRNGGFVEVGL
jgi:histidinol-phosphatase (PHP family)